MLIFQGISPQGSAKVGRVVTIGNFDGVHCGHQALIQETCAIANREGLTATAVTFAPHPKAFFAPEKAPGKIQGLRGKAAALSELGIQELWILRFRATLAEMPAQRFIRDFLCQSLHAKHIVVGDDFRFGAKRQGDFAMLLDAGATNNWQAHRVEAVSVDGERASSSTLRDALARGNLRRAESLMGRPYTLCGHVIHGRKLGRGLGFPTLNIPVDDQLVVSGVFAVRVRGLGSSPIAGVASLGRRPTTESQGRLLLEVHLFDWSGEAYGRVVEVIFHEKLRDEIYYTSVDAMTQQIERDAHAARHHLNDHVH